jgi:Dna[CI] antecedent DciA-like protein
MMEYTMGTRGGRNPVRVGNLLTAAVPALAERMLEEAIRREWAQTAGPEAARRSRPGALRQGTVEVSVDNSPWLQELTLRSAAIVAALRKRHGSAVIGVRFALGSGRGDADVSGGPARARNEAPRRRLTLEEARLVDAAAGQVPDPVLASSIKRLLTKDFLARGERPAPAASEQP